MNLSCQLKEKRTSVNIEEQFNLVAKEYDSKRKVFIPCFNDFYITSTNFIKANVKSAHNILDLGAGTGLLSYYYYQEFKNSNFVLVDIAKDMLEIAKKRFLGLDNFSFEINDYAKDLLKGDFDLIISALFIHHLSHDDKQILFNNIYKRLPKDGFFINHDQFCADSKEMSTCFDEYWISHLEQSSLSDKDLSLWRERQKLDRECSITQEILMLKKAGFTKVDCIYQQQKFAVIVAKK